MKKFANNALAGAIAFTLLGFMDSASAVVNVQCPGDTNGDAVIDTPDPAHPNAKCMHLIAGDSFTVMADSNPMYIFGYADRTGDLPDDVIGNGILDAEWPGTTVELDEGDEFFLSLTNVGTVIRPDLFDPHTVHFHGFPNAAAVFDGVPEVSISINMGSTLSYYYNIVEPGTYIYHCHVEATEHMEMGMLANLYVHPAQDKTGCLSGGCPISQRGGNTTGPGGYVYNDNDGTTAWDVEKALQVASFDSDFHDASLFVQPLPFALMEGDYPQVNGRGYPDTINPAALPAPADNSVPVAGHPAGKVTGTPGEVLNNGTPTQIMDSLIELTQGQRLLLRLSNVSLDRFWTLTAMGLKMKIVGTGARQMRGSDGKNLYRETASLNFGGGETTDVIIETADVAPGTYFLHATEVHQMSNATQLDGGMITEIVIN
ncbi:MAG: multicopper oxidase domain-containing protein [Candidatus Thiodiazotropha sp. (ex Epidulcina cf. delphinae)]|nr:multicopper oxidase domain-containing protein [Candidatus Thiodiazotropha sp. (ex Epidulcina cf. delphinae)]MCU7926683.1 multicopper oxidase domain-containing protein [Candidatus Thiodiazotropha sp. (ex Dulcina madagascariensis)]